MRNFGLVLEGIDPAPLLAQVERHPELWNNESRPNVEQTVLYAVNNITLRCLEPPSRGPPFRNSEAFSVLWEAQSIVFDVMRAIRGEILSQVVISKMAPGEIIAPHIDHLPPGFPLSFYRYQIPLSVKRGVRFICGDEELFMEPGSAYWFNNQITHSVENNSDEDRISMRIDVRPFGGCQ